jgi:hypothetical protein
MTPIVTRTPKGLIESPGAVFYYLYEYRQEPLQDGDELTNEEHQYRHVRQPFACVAIRAKQIGEILWVARGVAICSPRDNFSKARGRALAYKRLRQAETQREEVEELQSQGKIVNQGYPKNHRFQDRRVAKAQAHRLKHSFGGPTELEIKLLGNV